MPSSVYRGDLSEITFGHESGLVLEHAFGATDFAFSAIANGQDNAADTSIIELTSTSDEAGNTSTSPMKNGLLLYPKGMLVGSKVIFSGLLDTGSHMLKAADNYNVSGRSYTIVKHDVTDANKTRLTLTPALKTVHNTAQAKSSQAGSTMHILPFGTPAFDKSMGSIGNNAAGSTESVLTDQFVGLVSTVALPETKVDLKRYHVVGLGRDVAVQVPGRYTNVGGSFECNIHNGRWFYYCLGQKVSKVGTSNNGSASYTISSGTDAGSNYIHITGAEAIPSVDSSNIADNNSYIVLTGANSAMVDIQTYRETAVGGGLAADAWGSTGIGANSTFDKALKQEVRRIIGHAVSGSGGSAIHSLWLDEPLQYDYAAGTAVMFAKYHASTGDTSPNRALTGVLTNPVEHLYFSREKVPSFSMEVSVRRLDQGHNQGTTDGGTTDSKQLTRVFRGCKVKDFSLTADTDAALRLSANFDSAFCYTDTGRLETVANGFSATHAGNIGDRYNAHRLFEDTAATPVNRKVSGIEKGTQKPFMFYNGIITVLGQTVGQVVSFTLNGKTGVEQFYTISGANVVDNAADQVPHSGTRNPTLAIEGKTEYDLDMEIIVDDPVFYHNMRRAVRNFDENTSDSAAPNLIRLSFTKNTSAAGSAESVDILMDDFFITEASLPIPEDKGPLRSVMKILPKTIKVIAKDTVLAP